MQKIAVVTGANNGLGFETTIGLIKCNYLVIMACRSENRAKNAKKKIIEKFPEAKIEIIVFDLINRNSIKQFVQKLKKKFNHLDLLVNNAGIMVPPYTLTDNNQELQFDANHLGHFYLTALLFDLLDQDYETRIITLSSLAHMRKNADINFEDINFSDNKYDSRVGYAQSKLANALFGVELSIRIKIKNIKSVIVHPGVSNTDLSRHLPSYVKILLPMLKNLLPITKPIDGAKPTLFGCLNENIENGDYIGPLSKRQWRGQPGRVELSKKAVNQQLGKRLWEYSEKELGIDFL